MTFDPAWLPRLAHGLQVTLSVVAASIAIGFGIGILLAIGRVYAPRPIRWLCAAYIQFFRGTPLLVQLMIVYFGLPTWGITLSAFSSAILAFGLNTAAYQAEYFRGAIQAVRGGQMMAARSVGMSFRQAVVLIVLPQALRIVIPSWSNELILMLKYSSIAFAITLLDLMGQAKRIAGREFMYFEIYLVVAAYYLALVFIVSQLLRLLERRVAIPGLGAPGESR
ncbi:MAG: amino acid ABC transporter permease [Candidatus Bipolaricaulota bacterium]|nr:MAG: amino acid ABC transporter permease [Candidatus Bipolaricaulota bacterium]